MEIVEESKYKYKVDGEVVYYLCNDLIVKLLFVLDYFDIKMLKEFVCKCVIEFLIEFVYLVLEVFELVKFFCMLKDWEDVVVREI